MLIGVPKEVKKHEYRVGLTPDSVKKLVKYNHKILIEHNAGIGLNLTDQDYMAAGAEIVANPAEIFERAQLIVKVKEPSLDECKKLNHKQIIFTFLHLAAFIEQARLLQKSGCTAIAYETIILPDNSLPLLAPMSAIAGRLAVQAGAWCLEKQQGGRGVLLSSVYGTTPAEVLVLGAGVVGKNAIQISMGMGANVTVLDRSEQALEKAQQEFGAKLNLINNSSLSEKLKTADLVIGAVLTPGASAPKIITENHLDIMQPGAVIIDVAIDQGGCCISSKPTDYSNPIYIYKNIVHYCVNNMPGAVPRTSTWALNQQTLPYIMEIANKGLDQACLDNPELTPGINIQQGRVMHEAVARAVA